MNKNKAHKYSMPINSGGLNNIMKEGKDKDKYNNQYALTDNNKIEKYDDDMDSIHADDQSSPMGKKSITGRNDKFTTKKKGDFFDKQQKEHQTYQNLFNDFD